MLIKITLELLLQILIVLLGLCFFVYSLWRFFYKKRNVRTIVLDTFICITLLLTPLSLYSATIEPKISETLIQNNLLQFIGTVMAIFFSLAIVPISNIVQNTSASFVKQILRNEVILKSITLYFLIFVLVALQSLLGISQIASVIHFFYLSMTLITFLFLIYEIFRLLDVKNVLNDFECDAIENLDKKWKKITTKNTDLEKQTREMMLIKNALINETANKIEPIFVTTKRYIVLDHYDVVEKGLNSILNIAKKYVDLFSFSIQDNDRLLVFLIERLKDLKGAITETTHYSILPALVSACKELAIKSLEIKTPMSTYNRSYLSLGLITFLKEFVISKDLFKETSSAPMSAVSSLEEIAYVAIQKNNFNMAKSCLDTLTEISLNCTKLNFFFANQVSKESNASIMRIHYKLLSGFGEKYRVLPFLSESIIKPMKTFIEIGDDNPYKDNLSPFIGSGVDLIGITDPYSLRLMTTLSYVVFYSLSNNSVNDKLLLEYLEEIFKDFNRLLMTADDKSMFNLTNDIVSCSYDVAFTLMQYIETGTVSNKAKVMEFINNELFYVFSNSFEGSILKSRGSFDEKINKWFSVLGLYLTTYQTWEKFPKKTLEKVITKANDLIPKLKTEYQGHLYRNPEVENDLEEICEYLHLALYWEFNLLNDPNVRSMLLHAILKIQSFISKDFSDSKLPKPVASLGGLWSLEQPCVAYLSQYLYDSRTLLDISEQYIYQYSDFITKNEFYWKISQLVKFKLGQVGSYEPFHFRRDSSFPFF